MPRLAHGATAPPEQLRQAHADLAARAAEVALGFAVAAPAALQDFDFLFPEVQDDDANLLPRSATAVKRLKELGRTRAAASRRRGGWSAGTTSTSCSTTSSSGSPTRRSWTPS